MAYSEALAERIRHLVYDRGDVIEKKMFGGLAFMVRGHMAFGVNGDELMVRVGKAAYSDALAQPHAREMDFTGRSLRGMVYVAVEGLDSNEKLEGWLQRGLDFVETLPPK